MEQAIQRWYLVQAYLFYGEGGYVHVHQCELSFQGVDSVRKRKRVASCRSR